MLNTYLSHKSNYFKVMRPLYAVISGHKIVVVISYKLKLIPLLRIC